MKKASIVYLPLIALLPCLSVALSFANSNQVFANTGNLLSVKGPGHEAKGNRLGNLPVGLREKISNHLRQAKYEVSKYERMLPSGKTSLYRASNRKQKLAAYFTERGIHLIPGGGGKPAWHLEMALSGCGYAETLEPVKEMGIGAVKAMGGRVEYRRGLLTEWYENGEQGLEQGLTLNQPPAGKAVGRLTVEWTVTTPLVPRVEEDGAAIVFSGAGGKPVLRYSGLKAWDATGLFLGAKLELRNEGMEQSGFRIAYVVDDTAASYPVMIDPVFTEVKKLLPSNPSNGATGDYFGYSVSQDGDTVVVGAYGDDDNGTDSGSVHIFYRNQGGTNNWGEVTKVTASDGAAGDHFGYSVAVSGESMVIGARTDDDNGSNSGSAYIFNRNQGGVNKWDEVTKITASDGATGDVFGYSVSIDGDTVVIGAPTDNDNGTWSGSAYIFNRNQGGADNWGEVRKITASDGAANDYFGWSVAISGHTLVVGAYSDNNSNGTESGSAYIFNRNQGGADNWGEVTKITASDGTTGDYFGTSVAIRGDTLVVGAYGDDDNGTDSGSAYIFSRNQGGVNKWGEVTKITANDGTTGDYFGTSVAISGDTVVVGAYYDGDSGSGSGSAYIFYRNQGGVNKWGEVRKITASDGAEQDRFGLWVCVSGDYAVVGAYGDDDNGAASGSAYIFYRNQGGTGNWGQNMKIVPGASGDLFGYSVSVSGGVAVVGAPGRDDNGTDSGSAYIFYRNQGGAGNWGEFAKITPSDDATRDSFGSSVAISNDTVVVGADGDDDNGPYSGSAYIFNRNQGGPDNWGEVRKITASDGTANDLFGNSVAISGDTLVVGARRDDDNGYYSGSAYIFYRNQGGAGNWGEFVKITANDGAAEDLFGISVSIDADTLVVGALGDDDIGADSGSAYIFSRDRGGSDNWGEVTKITASDGDVGDWFGNSVGVSGDYAVVGAYLDNDNGTDSGSAYIFYRNQGGANNWGEVKKITPSDGATNYAFGGSVSIDVDTVVVGSYRDDDNGDYSGSAYIFNRNQGGPDNWGEVRKILASGGAAEDYFGWSVAISGNNFVVGAPYKDDNGADSGSAYVYKFSYTSAALSCILLLLLGD